MEECKIADAEYKFAELVWEHEPIGSGELVKLCGKELDWKKSTTYTVLRRLCRKGIFQNEGSVVTSLISKEEYAALRSEQFLEETFNGSLPMFLSAFMSRKKLTDRQVAEIQKMIDDYEG